MGKASSESKMAWMERNYKKYLASFRYDRDGDLIDYIEDRKASGTGITDIFREGIKALMMEEKK